MIVSIARGGDPSPEFLDRLQRLAIGKQRSAASGLAGLARGFLRPEPLERPAPARATAVASEAGGRLVSVRDL